LLTERHVRHGHPSSHRTPRTHSLTVPPALNAARVPVVHA
jgi:hypothetical protein